MEYSIVYDERTLKRRISMWKNNQWIKLFFVLVVLSFPVAGTGQEKNQTPEAQGKSIGNSKLEKEKLDLAKSILAQARALKKEILLPIDNLVVDKIDPNSKTEIVGEEIPEGKIAVDIGPKTIALFKEELKSARTVVWNGPLGIFEMDAFSQGTQEIAKFLSTLGVTTIIGGGDTASAVAKFKLEDKMTHISTGGGASLEFLEGKILPGISALTDK